MEYCYHTFMMRDARCSKKAIVRPPFVWPLRRSCDLDWPVCIQLHKIRINLDVDSIEQVVADLLYLKFETHGCFKTAFRFVLQPCQNQVEFHKRFLALYCLGGEPKVKCQMGK